MPKEWFSRPQPIEHGTAANGAGDAGEAHLQSIKEFEEVRVDETAWGHCGRRDGCESEVELETVSTKVGEGVVWLKKNDVNTRIVSSYTTSWVLSRRLTRSSGFRRSRLTVTTEWWSN